MSKFTPGPWCYHKMSPDGEEALISMGSPDISQSNYSAWMLCRNEANARLIAAAPCLLEALQNAVRLLNQKELSGSDYEDIRRFEKTIEKATKGDE